MFRDGAAFDDALKTAQDLGYAERNPAADVDGIDACRKIAILAAMITGKWVNPDEIPTKGITSVTADDVAYCEEFGGAIKLIGFAAETDGGEWAVLVCPAFVSGESQLATVSDVFNAILVRGDATGDILFYGKGAGKLPTASAVVSDITSALAATETKSLYWSEEKLTLLKEEQIETRFYVRINGDTPPNTLKNARVLKIKDGECAVITDKMNITKLNDLINGTQVLAVMRVLDY
jgi:homoserine dehydrogenase